jgi:hypothetical protein
MLIRGNTIGQSTRLLSVLDNYYGSLSEVPAKTDPSELAEHLMAGAAEKEL